jgi:transcriptional regulator of acetoin/glycerol metabolism
MTERGRGWARQHGARPRWLEALGIAVHGGASAKTERRYLRRRMNDETREDSLRVPPLKRFAVPGIVVVWEAGRAASGALPLGTEGIEIGRGMSGGASGALLEADDRVSRKHARVRRQADGSWHVEDLASRNGTFVNGQPLTAAEVFAAPPLVRVGRSLIWAVEDVTAFSGARPTGAAEGPVLGGRLRRVWGEIALASRAGDTLCIQGESGAGKELAARAFHEARYGETSARPFVAVNCAAIPEGLAERLLFGARKGAYSGAVVDAEGYVQAADQGTLFLDEIAELDPLVQAKLLRVLETREVLQLGASRPRKVELGICAASHKSLRDEVEAGRFREDLYFRLGRPEVKLPALRERIDEMPWLIARELLAIDAKLVASVGFVEACAQKPWPGNVRELLREIRRAGHRALAEPSAVVEAAHLSAEAGSALGTSSPPPRAASEPAVPAAKAPSGAPAAKRGGELEDEQIVRALAENGGNVRGTARALGMHRNQLRRWLEKHPEVVTADKGDASSDDD